MKKFMAGFLIILVIALTPAIVVPAQSSPLPGYGWWFGIIIQNVDLSSGSIFTEVFDSASSSVYAKSDNLAAGSSKNYNPATFSGMPSSFQGSARTSSDKEVRSIINTTNFPTSQGFGDLLSPSPAAGQYQSLSQPSTTLRFPLVKNDYYGKTTTFFIQNAGATSATASATFIFPTGSYFYYTPAIDPGKMWVIEPIDARGNGQRPPTSNTDAIGSLTVTASQPIAGAVIEHFTAESHATVAQATHAFTPDDYWNLVYAPVNKNDFYNRFTGLQVQNVSAIPITVYVTYYQVTYPATGCPGGTENDLKSGLQPGASWNFSSSVMDAHCYASAIVFTSDENGEIVATVNESFTSTFLNNNPQHAQESTTYSAIPHHSISNAISVPLYKEDAYSKQTGLIVQNTTSIALYNVVATFKNGAGQIFITNPMTIMGYEAIVLIDMRLLYSNPNPPSWWHGWNGTPMTPSTLGCGMSGPPHCGANGIFSVVINADLPIVAIANESTYPISNPRILQDKNNYETFNIGWTP